jgi:hypothetical protein
VPQGVNVEGPASVVNFGDSGQTQVAVENLDQLLWDG